MESTHKLVLIPEEQYIQLKQLVAGGYESDPVIAQTSNGARDTGNGASQSDVKTMKNEPAGMDNFEDSMTDTDDEPQASPPPQQHGSNGDYDIDFIVDKLPKRHAARARRLLGWLRLKRAILWRESDGVVLNVRGLSKDPVNIVDFIKDSQNHYKTPLLSKRQQDVLKALLLKSHTPEHLLGNK